MEYFCFQLSAMAGRNVIDKTGLKGLYDIHWEIPARTWTTKGTRPLNLETAMRPHPTPRFSAL